MGASHARALSAEGAKVVLGDILDHEGELVAKELGEVARYVHLDVTQEIDWESAVVTAIREFGGVDILVNNAGILNVGTIEEYDLAEWQRILDINLTGVFLGIRAVVKPMREAGRGSIINISSIEGMAGTIACHGYTASSSPCAADQVHSFGARAQRNSGELDPPGIDQDADDGLDSRRHLPNRLGPCRRPEGSFEPRRVSGQRRIKLLDRFGVRR